MSTQGTTLTGADWSLFTRLGSPIGASWLIQHRLPRDYVEAVAAESPGHPELHLQEYVLLSYADPGARMAAEGKLRQEKGVRSTIQDVRLTLSARINDHYANTPQSQSPQGYQWGLEALGAMSPWNNQGVQSAWDKVTGFGYVTIIDAGIQPGHPDLRENFRPHFSQAFYTPACPGNSLVNVDETGGAGNSCPNEYVGHGTHVAGIVGATPNNNELSDLGFSIGVGGVCWNCSLVIAKVLEADRLESSSAINGLIHAVMRGSQTANLSGGFPAYLGSTTCALLGPGANAFCDAISFARMREMLFIAATGNLNQSSQSDFPASEANVVAVAATNSAGAVWWNNAGGHPSGAGTGSNLQNVTFVAPGARVVSTFYENRGYNSACDDFAGVPGVPGVGYEECTGTSMAAAYVSGALTLVRSINPLSTATSIISLVSSTGSNVPKPTGPAGNFKMPSLLAAVNQAISNGYVWPAFAMVTSGGQSNRFTTAFPQMARASIAGTMLPTLIGPVAPVYYVPDPNASVVAGYPAFPDSTTQPRAYFKVYTKLKASQTNLKPLFRLSKLQNFANGRDQCGNLMPVPSKPLPVIHTYTISKSTRDQLQGNGPGQCYKYDGIEGYVAPSNLGGLQQLYQLYNPVADSFILVPSSKVGLANSLGYNQNQTSLGWVVPN